MLAAQFVGTAQKRQIFFLLFSSILALVEPSAASDEVVSGGVTVSASEAATAESLYQEGRRLLAAGKYPEACAALEASHRIEPAVGALLNLGRCFELNGQPASSWSTFSEADALARKTSQPERAALARQERDRIWPQVPRLLITVEALDAETRVFLDGDELTHGALGLPLAVDPGVHQVEVSHPRRLNVEKSFRIAAVGGEPTRLEISALQPQPLSTSEQPGAEALKEESGQDHKWSALKWSGLGATILGLGGAGVAVGMAVRAQNMANQADCDELDRCTDQGLEDREDAQSVQSTARIVGISFGALGAVGLTVFFLAPESGASTTAIRLEPLPGGGRAHFSTAF